MADEEIAPQYDPDDVAGIIKYNTIIIVIIISSLSLLSL